MATEIKAIQCPKCGSTEKTELRLDHFRCESCGTEYFLDNGNTSTQPKPGIVDPRRPATPAKGCGPAAIFFFIILVGILGICIIYIVSSSHSSSGSFSTSVAGSTEPPTWQYVNQCAYLSADRRPIIVGIGTLRDNRTPGQLPEPYIFFFDAIKDSLIKRFQIPGRDHTNTSDGWQFQQFSNGDLYVITERTLLYKIDKAAYSIKDVTQTVGIGQPELASGLAKAEFIPSGNNDGFRVVTNDGKELYYFPLLHKVYKEKEFWSAQTGMSSVLPSAKPATAFYFTSRRSGVEDDSDRLIKFRYLDNGIGPKQQESPEWQANGRPTPVKPSFDRILSQMNFTPGRLYFQPKVLYSDSDYVLISYAPTAANTGRLVQCLNARTAAIVFTTRLDDSNLEDGTIRYQGGFVLHYAYVYLIDMRGKLKKLKNGNYYGS